MVMEIGETIYVHRRADWRRWLRAHFQTKAEIWLVLPHKNSDKASIVYNDAVEEALCFGWIDSIKKKLAVDAAVQRYTPRGRGVRTRSQTRSDSGGCSRRVASARLFEPPHRGRSNGPSSFRRTSSIR